MRVVRFLAAGAVLVLAACAPTGPAVDSTPTVVALPSSTATTAPAEPLAITASGVGYVVVGEPVPSAAASDAIVRWDPTYCSTTTSRAEGEPWAGAWLPVSTVLPLRVDDTLDGLERGDVTMIVVYGPGIKTDQGIEVGDSETALKAAYAAFDSIASPYGYSTLYVVDGVQGQLVYEVLDGAVTHLSAVSLESEPTPFAGNDAGFPCI